MKSGIRRGSRFEMRDRTGLTSISISWFPMSSFALYRFVVLDPWTPLLWMRPKISNPSSSRTSCRIVVTSLPVSIMNSRKRKGNKPIEIQNLIDFIKISIIAIYSLRERSVKIWTRISTYTVVFGWIFGRVNTSVCYKKVKLGVL